MWIRTVALFFILASSANATDLHLRITAPTPDVNKIAVSTLFAALRDWANDPSVGANRQGIIDEFDFDASAVADLDVLAAQYLAIPGTGAALQVRQIEWLTVIQQISILAEEFRFGYDSRAQWAEAVNDLTAAVDPQPPRLSLTPTP
jgi:hypothetical protein